MALFDALKYGTIGLCAILMFFAYHLLGKEQQAAKPRPEIIKHIRLFMFLAVGAMLIGLCSQLPALRTAQGRSEDTQLSSGYSADFFTGTWIVTDAHDVATPQFAFAPRYSYTGALQGHVDGNEFVLSGILKSFDIKNPGGELGEAHFNARGPINNNEVAGRFTYKRTDVDGFGTAFMKFDSAGSANVYMIVRVTHVLDGEGDVAMVVMHLKRAPQ